MDNAESIRLYEMVDSSTSNAAWCGPHVACVRATVAGMLPADDRSSPPQTSAGRPNQEPTKDVGRLGENGTLDDARDSGEGALSDASQSTATKRKAGKAKAGAVDPATWSRQIHRRVIRKKHSRSHTRRRSQQALRGRSGLRLHRHPSSVVTLAQENRSLRQSNELLKEIIVDQQEMVETLENKLGTLIGTFQRKGSWNERGAAEEVVSTFANICHILRSNEDL